MKLTFTSVLDRRFLGALEDLLFFHPQQGSFCGSIHESIEKYGAPRIVKDKGPLRIRLEQLEDVQSFYALAEDGGPSTLVAAVVFTRTADGVLDLLHIAVKEEYTLQGAKSQHQVTFAVIDELCRIGQRIQGVHSVRLAYNGCKIALCKRCGPTQK